MNKACPECKGTGVYQGLFTSEPCKACAKPTIGIDMALGESKSVEMSFAMTADTTNYVEFIDKAVENLPKSEGRVPRSEKAKQKFKEMDARDFWNGAYPGVGFDTPPYEDPGDAKVDCNEVGKARPRMGDFELKYGAAINEARKGLDDKEQSKQAKAVQACKSFAATVARLMQQHSKLGMGDVVLVDELAEAIGVTRQDTKDLQYAYSYGMLPISFHSKLELAKTKYTEMYGNTRTNEFAVWREKVEETATAVKNAAIVGSLDMFNMAMERMRQLVQEEKPTPVV